MAWRPTQYLKEGELDNTVPGKVTGWIQFAGMKEKVTFELEGDFHRDIRGAKIRFTGEGSDDDPEAARYMNGFSRNQKGKVGDITAGMPPYDYTEGMANEHSTLEVERKENGSITVIADYGLVLDDWCRDDVGVALEGSTVAIRTYTAGYGLEYLDQWLAKRGGKVDVQVEGSEFDFVPLETALGDVQAAAQPSGPPSLRAADSNEHPA